MDYKEILRGQLTKLTEIQNGLDPTKVNESANFIACSNAIAQIIQASALYQIGSQIENQASRTPRQYPSFFKPRNSYEGSQNQ
jgi:hypothetical protein